MDHRRILKAAIIRNNKEVVDWTGRERMKDRGGRRLKENQYWELEGRGKT